MAVQFILGSAGAGKSHKLYEILVNKSMKNKEREYVAIVPEQYSLESQKEIVSLHEKHGAFNTEVVSFHRLARSIFDEIGIENVKVMDDLGKTLILRRVLEDCKKELKIYAKKIGMPGFVDKMKSTISELQQYHIDTDILEKMIETSDKRPSLKYKLKDVYTIYQHFNEYIKDKMITQEEILNVFCRYINQSEKIRNTEYFIDGFTGFTPIQKNVVDLLMKYAKNVTFAFTLPENEVTYQTIKEQELFCLSKKTIRAIKYSCKEQGIPVLEDIVIQKIDTDEGSRPFRLLDSGELSHIEENVFRYSKTKVYEKECRDVSIHTACNPRKEARFVASKIASMMICNDEFADEPLRYRDFAVITGDMDTYYRYLDEAFKEYGIPTFIDYKRSITANPFVDAIKAVIEIIEKDFSYESVFRYLRIRLLSEDMHSIDILENYVLMSGRRGFKSYSKKWEKQYNAISEEELEKINEVKDALVDSLSHLRKVLKDKNSTVKERITALYEFIQRQDMQKKLEQYADQFAEEGDLSRASEYRHTYAAMIELLDKVVDMLGDEVIPLKEFKGILESGFESIKVGIIPPGVDSVMVGDIERTRLKDIKKVIFLIGANDGVIPKSNVGGGIISDMERDFLESNNYELAPTARENAFTQKFYLYAALTKPSRRLFITFSKANALGEEIRKSYLVSIVQKMFANMEIVDEDNKEDMVKNIIRETDALRFISRCLHNFRTGIVEKDFCQVFSVLYEKEEYREQLLSMVDAAFYRRSEEKLDEKVARMLYGIKDNIGITRLERYASCAYAQFVQNGLKLQQRKHYELAAYDLGNLYHSSIDLFCKEIQKREIKWAEINEEKRKELVNDCVDRVIKEYDNDVLSSTARNLYIADRVKEVTDKTVKVLGTHLAMGKFEPKYYEFVVNHGRIDRVDVYEKDDRMYIKVIDYKSGNKKFSLEDTFYGLQLQLMVYLNDAIKKEQKNNPEKQVMPGGAFYYGIKNPYIEKPDFEQIMANIKSDSEYENLSDQEIKQKIAEVAQQKEFKMSGLLNANQEVVEAIDTKAWEGNGASDIIPLKYTKTGIDSRSCTISPENFTHVLNYVEQTTEKMQVEILSGNINPTPYDNSCTYCPYQNICKFDTNLGDQYKEKEKLKQEEILEKIRNNDIG